MSRWSLLFLLLLLPACSSESEGLVVYSGRSSSLVDDVIAQFEEETGIPVSVRYGGTAQLAVALSEEGEQTRADLFWAQDAGALGALESEGRLMQLPDSLLGQVAPAFQSESGRWVAVTGRARTLAYAPLRVDTSALPQSIFDLTDERFENRVGWPPPNGSFQAHVTAMRQLIGDDSTRAWLEAMKANGAKSYSSNSAVVQAIADGEIDLGLTNHYYLYRFRDQDPGYPVRQTFFAEGGPGNLVNIAGLGILENTERSEQAMRFISHMLSQETQQYFARNTFEYPVVPGLDAADRLVDSDRLEQVRADVNLNDLQDLETTLSMLRETGLL